MAKTKKEALVELRKFKKEFPHLNPVVIDETEDFKQGDDRRYNYQFFPKKCKPSKQILTFDEARKEKRKKELEQKKQAEDDNDLYLTETAFILKDYIHISR